MEEIIDYLEKSEVQYFATIGLDGKLKVKPFQLSSKKKTYPLLKFYFPRCAYVHIGDNI